MAAEPPSKGAGEDARRAEPLGSLRKRHAGRRPIITGGLIVVAVVIAASVVVACGVDSSPSGGNQTETTATETVSPGMKPQQPIEAASTCGIAHGDSFDEDGNVAGSTNFFSANATVENLGETGVVVDVTAMWEQDAEAPIRETTSVRVGVGATEEVHFSRVVEGQELARFEAAGSACTVDAVVVSTFE